MTTEVFVFMFLALVGLLLIAIAGIIFVLYTLRKWQEQIGMWLLTEAAARGALQKAAMEVTGDWTGPTTGTPAWPGRRKAGETH